MKGIRRTLLLTYFGLYLLNLLVLAAILFYPARYFLPEMLRRLGEGQVWLLLSAALAAVVTTLLVVRKVGSGMTERLSQIAETVERISAGEMTGHTYLGGRDEIGQVAEAVNRMAASLREQVKEISANSNRLETILSTMVEGVIVFNEEGRTVLTNPAAKKMLSKREENWVGRSDLELIRNAELHDKIMIACLGKRVQEHELKTVFPEEKLLSASIVPLKPGEPGKSGVLVVFRDITRLRRLEEIRADFAANVSHEMRTPLTAIRGYAETLLDGAYRDTETAVRFLKIIHRESERLNNLIEDVLMLSQIESGRADMELVPVNVAGLAEEVLESLLDRLSTHKLKLEVSPGLPPVTGDRGLLRQALFNLLDNSLKYTPAYGEITLGAVREEHSIRIYVADNGIGIPLAAQARIFERFYRVDRARSRSLGGTGLGLAIVKHIVEAHHGRLKLESKEGQGTTVSLYIPVYPPDR
ncbi:MAG: Alkaline phosphatase synthesis sensor protein PhoR [Syntrophomonadaceae bacterium]|nr:Alkaline phosphatase synthesis sensor protein PhoR [Bacillota bacterium]